MNALEFALGLSLTGLILLMIVGWFREAVAHQLFLARMRQWTRLDEPTLHSLLPGSPGVGSSSSVASIRALPTVRVLTGEAEDTGGVPLLTPDPPDAA